MDAPIEFVDDEVPNTRVCIVYGVRFYLSLHEVGLLEDANVLGPCYRLCGDKLACDCHTKVETLEDRWDLSAWWFELELFLTDVFEMLMDPLMAGLEASRVGDAMREVRAEMNMAFEARS